MKKNLVVKLEEFEVTAKKLVVDEVLDIAEEIAKNGYFEGFGVLLNQAKDKGWLKTIQDNRDIFKHIAEVVLIFPEGKSIGNIYPEELVTLFPVIMEVNGGFLEVMELTKVPKTKVPKTEVKKTPPKKLSRTSRTQ